MVFRPAWSIALHVLACTALLPAATLAQSTAEPAAELSRCRLIADSAQRLACYDAAAEAAEAKVDTSPAARALLLDSPRPASEPRSLIGDRWGLGASPDDSRFDLRAHRPSYFLLGRYSDNPNRTPTSPTRLLAVPPETADIDATEAKFQVSFKVKLADFGKELDWPLSIWAAYSQQSSWQIYNSTTSRPFRETNYEPELMVAMHPDIDVLGWRWRLAAVGLNHQSNGRAEPLSRSWNRVVAQFGLERGNFALLVRPWLRIRETGSRDDNPDLTRYLGHGETVLIWAPGAHQLSLTGRVNIGSGKGALQGHWTFPLSRRVRGMVQVFSGYGESLIDYNVRQNTIGLGISLADHL